MLDGKANQDEIYNLATFLSQIYKALSVVAAMYRPKFHRLFAVDSFTEIVKVINFRK